MGGHPWAHAHPAPAVLGHGIRADPRVFLGGEGDGDLATDLQMHHTLSLCSLLHIHQVHCIYLASGRFASDPHWALDPAGRLPCPRPPVPTPGFRAWLHHCPALSLLCRTCFMTTHDHHVMAVCQRTLRNTDMSPYYQPVHSRSFIFNHLHIIPLYFQVLLMSILTK